MLLCIPLLWALVYSLAPDRGDLRHTVRNPLILGAVSFAIYLMVEFLLMPVYPPDFQLGPAFRIFSVNGLVFPLGLGTLLFSLLFRNRFRMPDQQLMLCYQSFMTGFLFLLSIHDLVVSISWLTPVELFLKPIGLMSLYMIVAFIIAHWAEGWRKNVPPLLVLGACQLLVGLGLALVWINQPLIGLLLLLPPLTMAVAILVFPKLLVAGLFDKA